MLYSLFLYESSSGLLIWSKSFEEQMNHKKVELFSSFFSAIQSFVKEIVSDGIESGLKNIEMGNFLININHLKKLDLDIVTIADKGDEKAIKKISPSIIKLMYSHQEIFESWDGDLNRFKVLDYEILNLLNEKGAKLVGDSSLADARYEILANIFKKSGQLPDEHKIELVNEKKFLEKRLIQTSNLHKKIEIVQNLEENARKLQDLNALSKYERQKERLFNEIDSTKMKLGHFLCKTKEVINTNVDNMGAGTLKNLDFKEAYINLYSFSTKLSIMGQKEKSEKYRAWARILIDKEDSHEFSETVRNILRMPDNIDQYLE